MPDPGYLDVIATRTADPLQIRPDPFGLVARGKDDAVERRFFRAAQAQLPPQKLPQSMSGMRMNIAESTIF